MDKQSHIYIAGHRGLAGSAILRRLQSAGYTNLVLRTHAELDLENQLDVDRFFAAEVPEYVFLAAAKVGGIHANRTWPADFLRSNLLIQNNTIDGAWRHGAKKLLFLGSSCIYPRLADQPIREDALLTGPLEETNEAYAVAKIAGIKLVQAYRRQYGFNGICLMPTNLYGPGDNYDLQTSHVLPALVRKFADAKSSGAPEVTVWGSGRPRREFLHSDDLADAAVFLMERYNGEQIVNVGTGSDVTIAELAGIIGEVIGYEGRIIFDSSMPDGTPRKLLDVSRLNALGWSARIPLREGLSKLCSELREHQFVGR
jgi:GDP-L-fucose synthase